MIIQSEAFFDIVNQGAFKVEVLALQQLEQLGRKRDATVEKYCFALGQSPDTIP